ncbi:hypothetical protein FIV42_27150 [Persicimonas caeni]|uniref:Uncharacterized protein n=1 Tax=Persicimonas caeni TaxID=2292766 RepID=A0A4Y6Q1G2_PERCE|nr:hypothetical protein [Persicimonas caeni]QDG54289.1 hypothetical protein FIV42_27150 [Persicimonas caeni]QED35510.1 hypothetical protein FRD00_27145 [Persicimonas caeni]
MDTSQLLEQVNDVIDSLFSSGSRYQLEKIVTIAVYAIISVASLVWAFSGGSGDNELGAKFEVEQLTEIDDLNLHLINDSDAWTNVRVVLNQKYLWTTDKVEAGRQKTLRPKDFEYYYYIPRPWGRHDWELLAQTPKPGPEAPSTLEVEFVQIRASQGSSDVSFGAEGNTESGTGENVAEAQ